ncbi:MAG: hypothetical protein ONA69_07900 [candidate division KSB1 bacterium]|nr:hypothetical protein [candidate division KSB1 bacterium]MDZ7346699.1 hypothetical protein [candidate division KSB1 bacterium]
MVLIYMQRGWESKPAPRKAWKIIRILLFLQLGTLTGWAQEPLRFEPIRLAPIDSIVSYSRAVFDVGTRFSPNDTVLLLPKVEGLQVTSVETKSIHELEVSFRLDAEVVCCGKYQFAICDSNLQRKAVAVLDILSPTPPMIDSIRVAVLGRKLIDTLLVDPARPLTAHLCLFGRRLPQDAQIEFADPAITVKQGRSPNTFDLTGALCVEIEIKPEAVLGEGLLTLKSAFAPAGVKKLFLRSPRPPRLFSEINDLTADGKSRTLLLEGSDFALGVKAKLTGMPVDLRSRRISADKLEIRFSLPLLEEAVRCRLIVENPDGQSDTSNIFLVLPTPLAPARAEPVDQSLLFAGRPTRLLITAAVDRNRRLQKSKTYEIVIDSQRFPVQVVTSDSTCEAEIEVPISLENRLQRQHVFTLQETGRPPQWRGVFSSRLPPRIDSISSNLILHPGDSLTIMVKGARLKDMLLGIADPEVTFQILEQREDFVRVTAASTMRVRIGDYPLEAYIQGTVFTFEAFRLSIRPWQPFSEYIVFHLSSSGDLPPESCFRGVESTHIIKAGEMITVRIKPSRINPKLGTQKLLINGVLTDSSGAVRAESLDSRRIAVSAGDDEITWSWRGRERIRSGDRLEITLQNPGNQNRITEYFVVAPHWSEAFHGSTSFILCKIPFGGGDEKTQILNSIGLGVSWQPFVKKRFFEVDAAFIVGNARYDKSDYSVQVGTGISAILWQHLQLGIGANLTGQSSSKGFIFIGTRFKLPISL